MEGRGFYNNNAAIPAAGGALALPPLEQAARSINIDTGNRSIVIGQFQGLVAEHVLAKQMPLEEIEANPWRGSEAV
jgi:hypothetical protein